MTIFFNSFFSEDSSTTDSPLSKRINSYDFLSKFLAQHYTDITSPPNTEDIVAKLRLAMTSFDNERLAFLICHTGYIPEMYPADSSLETIYTKLIETIVVEWAIRIGFTESSLPTQKSSKEDVTIDDSQNIIVCDAKSFRLGRSQAAPNVKDVLKHADISKWLSSYTNKCQLGGLVTFPSQHDWKKGSDFYQYTTDHQLPTICLNYEHMSFFLLCGYTYAHLINIYKRYQELFPFVIDKAKSNRDVYYKIIEHALFGENLSSWIIFKNESRNIVSEFVYHSKNNLSKSIFEIKNDITNKYMQETDIEKLRKLAIENETLRLTEDLKKQLDRIDKFRTPSDDYLWNH
ncbi:HindIII family type II restriction endonuclease [Aeromonas salmonicida]|uniref:HindIII family type II restriction endonuclease n=1 Tax=Aeromonas salmonicida TaxID=645 RepID=UPI0030CDFBDD